MAPSVSQKMKEFAELQWLQVAARFSSVIATLLGVPFIVWMASTMVHLQRESAVTTVRLAQIERDVVAIQAARQRDSDQAQLGRTEFATLSAEVRAMRGEIGRLVQLVDAQFRPAPAGGR